MADDFPTDVDVVVIGTGLPESIVSAALSRTGKKVLHLDRNEYYGSQWATFNLNQFIGFLENQKKLSEDSNNKQSETGDTDVKSIPVSNYAPCIWNVVVKSYMPSADEIEEDLCAKNEAICDDAAAKNEEGISNLHAKDDKEANGDTTVTITIPPIENLEIDSNTEETASSAESIVLDSAQSLGNESEEASCPSATDVNPATMQTADGKEKISPSQIPELSNIQEEQSKQDTGANLMVDTADVSPAEQSERSTAQEIRSKNIKSQLEIQAKLMSASKNITMEDLVSQSRKFNIDLSPKILFSRGDLVESLIEANISHYADFRVLDRILMMKNDILNELPCSKGDVFKSSLFTVMEKRVLMKFLTYCQQFDKNTADLDGLDCNTFVEFMKNRRLTDMLIDFILNSVAMTNKSCPVLEGLERTKLFLSSVGRYGNSPFLWPMYGTSEIPQAFCRMSAVFAGTFCLRKAINKLIIDDEGLCCSVKGDGDITIKAKYVVMESGCIESDESDGLISRCVLLTVGSLKESSEEHLTLSMLPPLAEGGDPVSVLEVGASSAGAPKGIYVTHLSVAHNGNAEENLSPYVTKFFTSDYTEDCTKPRILWAVYFNCNGDHANQKSNLDLPKNVFVTSLPGGNVDGIDTAVLEARKIFDQICPGEKFLEAVPNPEDIIWDAPLTAPDASTSGFEKEEDKDTQVEDKSSRVRSHSNAEDPVNQTVDPISTDDIVNQSIEVKDETCES